MGLPLIVAVITGENSQVLAFSLTGLLTIVMASIILLLTGAPKKDAKVKDALAVALLWCFGAPIPAALPFVFGTAEPHFIAGLHEAISCLTTTGHSVIDLAGNEWPMSLLVWRGVLHFLGMVFSLTIAASVFAALGFGGLGIHKSYLFTVPEGNFFDAIPRAVRAIFVVCSTLVLVTFSGLALAGVESATALSLAISVASTGLVDPSGYAGISVNLVANVTLFVGLFFATAGLSIMLNLRPHRLKHAEIDPELFLMIGLTGFVAVLAWFGGMEFFSSLGWSISALSTSGVPVGGDGLDIRAQLPLSVLVFPALIGGSALSTAGGIKLARIIILIRRAGQEFARLGFQHSIVALKFKERQQKAYAVLGVWVYLVAYIAAVALLFMTLSFLNVDFSSAIAQATGAISNSGWLVTAPENGSYLHHIALCLGMILGRLEILALLPAFTVNFWSR